LAGDSSFLQIFIAASAGEEDENIASLPDLALIYKKGGKKWNNLRKNFVTLPPTNKV